MYRIFRFVVVVLSTSLVLSFFIYTVQKQSKDVNAIVGSLNVTTPTISSPTITGNANFPGGIWNSYGNVGIGTTTPGQKLEINGNIQSDADIYLGTRTVWLSSWLNQNLSTTADPTFNSVYLANGNSRIYQGGGGSLHQQSPYGYIELGAQNSSWGHIQTDRPNFYFNKSIYADGNLCIYSSGTCFTNIPTTYGSFGLTYAKNGYYSILFGQGTGNANWMWDGSGNGGLYYENWGWGMYYYTPTRHLNINTSSDLGQALGVSGGIIATGNIYPNNQTTYGMRGNDGYFDTVNTGVPPDPLEINYRGTAPTRICQTVNCGLDTYFDTSGWIETPGEFYPGNPNRNGRQGSYYLAGNYGSVGLYTNTSFMAAGGLYLSGYTNNYLYNDGTYIKASTYLRAGSGIYSDGWIQSAGYMYAGQHFVQAYGYYVYPGSNSGLGSWQTSYYLASNSSWGLYTNTSMYSAGGFYAPLLSTDGTYRAYISYGCWNDQWLRITTDNCGSYHAVALGDLYVAGAVQSDLTVNGNVIRGGIPLYRCVGGNYDGFLFSSSYGGCTNNGGSVQFMGYYAQ